MVSSPDSDDSLRDVSFLRSPRPRPRLWVWPGLLLAPTLFLSQLSLNYALVPAACASQQWSWLSVVPAVSLLVTVIATLLARRDVRAARLDEGASTDGADLFLARCALAVGTFSSIAIVLQWATQLAVHPCVR
jgi:hypothetical protein